MKKVKDNDKIEIKITKENKTIKLLSLIFIIAGLALLFAGFYDAYNYEQKMSNYSTTTGKLSGYNTIFGGSKKPVYTYNVNGESYEVEATYSVASTSTSSSEEATIYYDSNNYMSSEVASIGPDWFIILSGLSIIAIAVGFLIKSSTPITVKEQVSRSKVITTFWAMAVIMFAVGLETFICSQYDNIMVVFGTTTGIIWTCVLILAILTTLVLWSINIVKEKNKALNLY